MASNSASNMSIFQQSWSLIDRAFLRTPAMVHKARPIQSEAISIARVLCIVGIVYAHAWTGRTGAYIVAHSDSIQGMLRWFLVETIGRSSVPLLGMVSGWLVASSALRRSYWKFVAGKARTILAPMVLWNLIALILVGGAVWFGWLRGPSSSDPFWFFNEVFSFSAFNNINVQTPFLRDLFVGMLMAPVLIRLRSPLLLGLIGLVLAWSIWNWWFPLILRPQVLLFFLVGIGARRWALAEYVGHMPFLYAALPFALLAPFKFAISVWGFEFGHRHPELITAVDVAMRMAAGMLAWRTALALAGRPSGSFIKRFEPYVFLLFCSHLILIWLFGLPVGRMFGPLDAPGYPIFLIAQPFIALLAAIFLGRLLFEISPGAAALLSGGRLRVDRESRNMALATA